MIFTANVYYTYINFDILICWKSYNCITGCYIEMFWCCQRHLSIFGFAWQVLVAKLLKRQSATKIKSPFCLVIKFPNQDGETGQGNAIDSVERWIVFTEYCYAKMKRVMFKLNFCCRSWIIWCKNFWVQLWKSWPLDTAGTADWFRDFQTWTRQDQQNSQQFPFSRLITRWLRRDGRTHARCSSTRVERLLLWQGAGSPAPLEMNSLAWRWISGDDGNKIILD